MGPKYGVSANGNRLNYVNEKWVGILGCPAKSANAGIRGELGWWLMQTRRDFMKIKWWIQLLLMNPDRLSKKVYHNCRHIFLTTRRNNFAKIIFNLAIKYDLIEIWNDEARINTV